MSRKIQFKRGLKAQLPILAEGEPAWVTNEGRLYIGTGTGNIAMARNDHTHIINLGTDTEYSWGASPLVNSAIETGTYMMTDMDGSEQFISVFKRDNGICNQIVFSGEEPNMIYSRYKYSSGLWQSWEYNIYGSQVSKMNLVYSNISVSSALWISDTTYSAQGYNWRAAIGATAVTSSHVPSVVFSCADAISNNYAPVASSYDGGVYIYCKNKPSGNITIPSITCVKGL